MKIIECWAVYEWDGGDRHNFAYRLSKDKFTEEQMNEFVGPHGRVRAEIIVVFDSFEERKAYSQQELRRSAWAKLTPLERQALNLEEPK